MNGQTDTPTPQHSHTPILVTGLGMVTHLGWDTPTVWRRLCAGESGIQSSIESPVTKKQFRCARVEEFQVDEIVPSGRTRRSSAVSHFAVGAGALALRDAKLAAHPRIGVIVAVSMGGVVYSRRFHNEFIQGGGRNVSPMLFPETVYNAPASHIASVLGLTGLNYTVIGDFCSSTTAIAMALDFLRAGMLDQCLVVATEELDWIVIEGFRRFGLAARSGSSVALQPFAARPCGFLAGEGAVALLLETETSARVRKAQPYAVVKSCDRGFPFHNARHMYAQLRAALRCALDNSGIGWEQLGAVFCSANGTKVDEIERKVLEQTRGDRAEAIAVTSVKGAVGESHAASGLFQIAAVAMACRNREVPPTAGAEESALRSSRLRLVTQCEPVQIPNFLSLCVGFTEQVSVVVLAAA